MGSLLALNLSQRGYAVDVFERRPDPGKHFKEGGRSINLALSHRGWRALEAVGVADEVSKWALPMSGRQIHPLHQEERFAHYGKQDEAIYSVSRARLNLLLLEHAAADEQVQLHFEHRALEPDLDDRKLRFDYHGQAIEKSYDWIFGTDGAFSALRTAMMKKPRFNYQQHYLPHGYKELRIPPRADGGFAMRPDALHIWPRKEFMMIALPNPDGSFTCTLFMAYEGQPGFDALETEAQVREFFEDQFADAVPLMPDLVSDYFSNPTPPLVTIRCGPWNYGRRILLIGDASHAIVPFYGQGMNSGFEDVRLLVEALDEPGSHWEEVIPAYARDRKPDADAIADLALHNFVEMRDLVDDPHFLRKRRLEQAIWNAFPEHWLPLYSLVTFSHRPYREALERGRRQDALLEEILQKELLDSLLEDDGFVERIMPYVGRLHPEVMAQA